MLIGKTLLVAAYESLEWNPYTTTVQGVLGEWTWSSPLEILQAWGTSLQDRSWCFGLVLLAGSLLLTEAQAGDCCSICPVQALSFPFGHFPPHMPAVSRRPVIQALPALLNYHNFPLGYSDILGPNKQKSGKSVLDVVQSRHTITVKPKHHKCNFVRYCITPWRKQSC